MSVATDKANRICLPEGWGNKVFTPDELHRLRADADLRSVLWNPASFCLVTGFRESKHAADVAARGKARRERLALLQEQRKAQGR